MGATELRVKRALNARTHSSNLSAPANRKEVCNTHMEVDSDRGRWGDRERKRETRRREYVSVS